MQSYLQGREGRVSTTKGRSWSKHKSTMESEGGAQPANVAQHHHNNIAITLAAMATQQRQPAATASKQGGRESVALVCNLLTKLIGTQLGD